MLGSQKDRHIVYKYIVYREDVWVKINEKAAKEANKSTNKTKQ